MAHVKLNATKREAIGNQVKKLRKNGVLPGVIYSKKTTPINLQFSYADFYKVFKQAGKTQVVDLVVDEKKALPCIVHDMDIDPVYGLPRHVDFLQVNLKEKVVAAVPVEYIGEAPGVKEFGAVLNTPIQELDVEALPDELPESIIVDVSSLAQMTDVIKVEDLKINANFKIVAESDLLLAGLTAQSEEEPEEQEVVVDENQTEADSKAAKETE